MKSEHTDNDADGGHAIEGNERYRSLADRYIRLCALLSERLNKEQRALFDEIVELQCLLEAENCGSGNK